MTDNPGEEVPMATVQPVAELFTRSASALWATTYGVDLGLFSEFLLPRLGDPPLNIAVLADDRRLAASLDRIPRERADTLATVNRRWLLRGIRPGGAFHPKSYLAITSSQATLLVGSGNLSASGLDDGLEVFTTFRSGTAPGDAAIVAWRSWMRRLIGMAGDAMLAARFQDLEQRIPPTPGNSPAGPPPLLHNLDIPIADQLAAITGQAGGTTEELLISAPFYDSDAAAVGELLDTLSPRRVQLFVTGTTNVNGVRLAERLTTSGAQVTVTGYEPDRFVHAKLIGVITARKAWLLSGSANLSRAALTLTPAASGNVELAVLSQLDASELRAVFAPPGMTLAARNLGSLSSLAFRADPEPDTPHVRLITATALADGRVEVVTEPPPARGWLLDDLATQQPLAGTGNARGVTSGPLPGRLVQIVDATGCTLSNRSVVDDSAALTAALTAGPARPGGDRPAELEAGDLETPLGHALVWLHRNLVMDVSERPSASAEVGVASNEAANQDDDRLWERLEREQLARDPRAGTYERIWKLHAPGSTDPILELLDALGARIPASTDKGQTPLALLLKPAPAEPSRDDSEPGRPWKASARIRVRARNLLRRWASAQADPRLMWVDPLAPAGNFAMITEALAYLRLEQSHRPRQVELSADDLDDIWQRWLRFFAGTGIGDGWLDRLDQPAKTLARDRLPGWLPEAVAALSWLTVQPGSGYRDRVINVQPVLSAALAYGLLDPTETTAQYLTDTIGRPVTREQVDGQLLAAADFIDDELWCARTAEELGLAQLTLEAPPGARGIQVKLGIRGIPGPLLDPRMPRLIIAARHYRRCDGIAIYAADTGWRLVLVTGRAIAYKPTLATATVESPEPLARDTLDTIAAAGGVLADLLPASQTAHPGTGTYAEIKPAVATRDAAEGSAP